MKKSIILAAFLAAFAFVGCKHCDPKTCTDPNCKERIAAAKADSLKNGATAAAYDCPMHCEGAKSDKAGKCPKCGMDLEKQKTDDK
jgi:uncharacterized paraquat-inducible protein A